MPITTANIKSPDYTENHEIYVGTHTGSLKKISVSDEINPHKQINLEKINALIKASKITALSWTNVYEKAEILIGRANKFVKTYNTIENKYTSNIEMLDGPIIGLVTHHKGTIIGFENGKIQIYDGNENQTIIETYCNHMSKMRQCKVDCRFICTGGRGRENNVKVWNLADHCQLIFSSKNVKNDSLGLEVPVWDNDIEFLTSMCLVTCSRYGYIRLYDMRKQRRPILEHVNIENKFSYSCLANFSNMIYCGTTTGIIHAFDTRKFKHVVHTYKGFTGSISDMGIDESGQHLYTACLDRFVRVHCAQTTALQYQCYIKSKATKILLKRSSLKNTNVLQNSDCTLLSNDTNDDQNNNSNVENNATILRETAVDLKTNQNIVDKGVDQEFDELFSNMPTISDDVEKNDEHNKHTNKRLHEFKSTIKNAKKSK